MAVRIRDTQIGFRVSSQLKKQLEQLAEADNRPLSNYLEHILKAHAAATLKRSAEPRRSEQKSSSR
jgi:predicted transcriptional regulator